MYPGVGWDGGGTEDLGRLVVSLGASGSAGGRVSSSSSSVWLNRAFTCRIKYLKLLLLVVLLLMMAQFSLNILVYRNYDSLFYVNVTSTDLFESRVRLQVCYDLEGFKVKMVFCNKNQGHNEGFKKNIQNKQAI